MNRRILITLLVALATGVLAFLALRTEPRRITLPDGNIVEFLGTTVGQQVFSTEQPWDKAARRILPARFHGWLPAVSRATCSSGTNSITVFFKVTNPSGAPVGNSPWQGYQVEDDAGFFYNRDGGYCSFGGGTSSQFYGLSLSAHPRRQGSFRFHFLDASNAIIGTIRVPNPVKGPFPAWTPQPLPQTVTNGPLIITAERLQRHGSKTWHAVSARWEIDAAVPHWKRARVRSSTLLDATGNDAQWLSPQEPAWRLRTTFHRERDDDFLPEERWRLNEIPIPAKGQFINLDHSTNILGVTIVAQVMSSPGTFRLTNGVHRALDGSKPNDSGFSSSTTGNAREDAFGSSKPFLMVEVQGRQEGDDIRINVIDDQGRKLTDPPNGTLNQSKSSTISLFVVRLDIPSDAKSLSVETVVSRPLVFEFMVNPKDLLPSTPPEPK